jgi:hypothetical protein
VNDRVERQPDGDMPGPGGSGDSGAHGGQGAVSPSGVEILPGAGFDVAAVADARSAWASSYEERPKVRFATTVCLVVVLLALMTVPLVVMSKFAPSSVGEGSVAYGALDVYARVEAGAEVSLSPEQRDLVASAVRSELPDGSYTLSLRDESGCWLVEIGGLYEPPVSVDCR